jgi:TonB-linked SusC/RagA family outer membrane protein
MRNLLLTMMIALFSVSVSMGQGRVVTGTVTEADTGEPIPGANVIVKGTSSGSVTDLDGNFTVNVSSDDAVLLFSFVGFVSQEIPVGNQSAIDVALASDVTALSEVVVTGYGTQEKKEITSAVASVKEKDFNVGMVNNPAQLIQGKVAGLIITKPGGDPNDDYTIRLRGVSTFGANQEPLIVIDGFIGASLNSVDPADIASMDVLKDASAAAIYGTRGSSGVILITTKSGKKGRARVSYNGSVAFDMIDRTMKFMTADEYRQVPGAVDFGSDTDWLKEVTQTGVSQIHNLSLDGGSEKTQYRLSVNYRDIGSIGLNTGFEQINTRLNLSQKVLNDKGKFILNLSSTTRDAQLGSKDAFRYAVLSNPTMPVLYDGSDGLLNVGGYSERDVFDYFNPVSIAKQLQDDQKYSRLMGQLRFEYDLSDFVNGLRVSTTYSNQIEDQLRGKYAPSTLKFEDGNNNRGNAERFTEKKENSLWESTLDWVGDVGIVSVKGLLGYSYQSFYTENFYAGAGRMAADELGYNNLAAAEDFKNGLGDVRSYAEESELSAYFARVNLTADNTYFFSASVRREGSTRFGANNRWGWFPAVSAGVDVAQIVSIPVISQLKVRGSYGRTGALPQQVYVPLERSGPTGNFLNAGTWLPSYGPLSNPNPDLAWETTEETNFGLDFVTENGKWNGSFEYYTRNVSDLIALVDVTVPPNQFQETFVNIAKLETTGFEFLVNWNAVQKNNFNYSTTLNFSTFSTKIKSLTSGEFSFGNGGVLYRANMGAPGQNDTRLVRIKEGEPFGDLWGPVWDGTSLTTSGDAPGTPIFEDLDGSGGDYCNCEDDRTVIGNGLPDFSFGWNSSFQFGQGWDASLFFRGTFGHDLLNSYRAFYENTESTTVGTWNIVKTDAFNPDVKKAVVNSTHVEKASYVKLDNASIGYTFKLANNNTFNNLRLSLAGQNLFVITDYSGIDPEVRMQDLDDPENPDNLAPGIERRSTFFTTRTITFGVAVQF